MEELMSKMKSADIDDFLNEIDEINKNDDQQLTQKQTDPKNEEIETSTKQQTESKSTKKKLDPQARMQKLLAKQNKRHNKNNGNSYDYDDEDDSNLDPDSKAWKEFINLICVKGIVLRPQIIFDFIVLEVLAFCGGNMTISMPKDINTNQSDSIAKDATISRIEGFIPIINNPKYYALNNSEEKYVDDEKGSELPINLSKIDQNSFGFGVISKRSTKMGNRRSASWNMMDYMIFPSFLNKLYKWTVNDNLYFTTLYKNFEDDHTGDNDTFMPRSTARKKVDDTYYVTGNIGNGFIIFLNKSMTKKLSIIQTPHSLFYTDDRIKYRNLKVPTGADKYNDKVTVCQQLWQKQRNEDVMQVWVQGQEDTNLILVNIEAVSSFHVGTEKIQVMEIVTNTNACSIDKYQEFGVRMNQISDELNADHLKKYPYQPDNDDDESKTDRQPVSNPVVIPNAKIKEYNQLLKDNRLLKIKQRYKYIDHNNKYEVSADDKKSLLKPFTKRFSLNTAYLDEQGTEKSKIATLYMVGEKTDVTAKWKLFMRIRGTNVNKENVENYNKRYMKFIAANEKIVEEGCDILFCDERIATKKKLIGIFGENMLVLQCYNNDVDYAMEEDGKDDGGNFAKIYNVKDVIPDLFSVELKTSKSKYMNEKTANIVRGGKWYYSYNTQTLYVFERISTSGKNPFRLRRIFLHTFKF